MAFNSVLALFAKKTSGISNVGNSSLCNTHERTSMASLGRDAFFVKQEAEEIVQAPVINILPDSSVEEKPLAEDDGSSTWERQQEQVDCQQRTDYQNTQQRAPAAVAAPSRTTVMPGWQPRYIVQISTLIFMVL